MPVIRKPPLYPTTLQQDRAPDQVSRFSQIDLLLQAGLILNRISKCSCETYGKRARIGSELVLGFRASLRVFDGDLYNEFSTTNILLGPRNLCSHVILVERRNFDVHAFCHSRSPLMSHQEQYYAPETGCCPVWSSLGQTSGNQCARIRSALPQSSEVGGAR
jgi:hypothetical protein